MVDISRIPRAGTDISTDAIRCTEENAADALMTLLVKDQSLLANSEVVARP